jgi:hypothetical protein
MFPDIQNIWKCLKRSARGDDGDMIRRLKRDDER